MVEAAKLPFDCSSHRTRVFGVAFEYSRLSSKISMVNPYQVRLMLSQSPVKSGMNVSYPGLARESPENLRNTSKNLRHQDNSRADSSLDMFATRHNNDATRRLAMF